MLRKHVIQQHIQSEHIHHVIGHNSSVFLKLIFKNAIFLTLIYLIFLLVSWYITWEYTKWIVAGIGVILCIKCLLDFFNLYLDGLALTPSWLTLFLWDGLLKAKTEVFTRDKISSVSYVQNSLRDKIFLKGDILIRLEHEIEFPFEQVSYPKKQMNKIIKFKDQYGSIKEVETQKWIAQEEQKLSILVEALGEVVKEYLDKRPIEDENEEYDDPIR